MRIRNGKLTLSTEELAPKNRDALKAALLTGCNAIVECANAPVMDGEIMLTVAAHEAQMTRDVNMCLNSSFTFPVCTDVVDPAIIFPFMESYVRENIKALQDITDNMCAKGQAFQIISALIAGLSPLDGKFYGVFSKMSPQIPISLPFIKYTGLTGEDLAAIVAHEIGHFYDIAEMFARGLRDLTLADTLTRGIRAAGNQETVETLLRTAERIFKVKLTAADELVTIGDNKTLSMVLLRDLGMSSQLMTPASGYKREINADNFAASIFGPVPMARALAKLEKMLPHGVNDSSSSFEYHIVQLAPLFAPLMVLGAVPALGWLVGAGIGSTMAAMYLYTSYRSSKPTITHPDMAERLKLLRSGLIMRSRGGSLSKDQLKGITKDIATLDDMIKTYDFTKFPVMSAIVGFFNPKDRKIVKARDLDVTLSQLSNNKLWVQAQQLKNM